MNPKLLHSVTVRELTDDNEIELFFWNDGIVTWTADRGDASMAFIPLGSPILSGHA